MMNPEEIKALHFNHHDMTFDGKPFRVNLDEMRVLEMQDGQWQPLQNLDLQADILRALNDGYGPNGD